MKAHLWALFIRLIGFAYMPYGFCLYALWLLLIRLMGFAYTPYGLCLYALWILHIKRVERLAF
jgi:hypothetical protein